METKTEENVPINTPRLMVSAKSWIAPPPRIVRLRAAIRVVAEVMIVRQGSGHAQVDDVGQRGGVVFRLVLEVFADTVIHDDGVVERVAHERHQRRDDVQVDLFAIIANSPKVIRTSCQKPHDGAEGIIQLELPRNEQGQRQGTDHPVYHVHPEEAHDVHGRTENRRHERGDHPALFEAPGNVHGNQQDGEIHGLKRRIPQIRADLGPHHLQTLDAGRLPAKLFSSEERILLRMPSLVRFGVEKRTR